VEAGIYNEIIIAQRLINYNLELPIHKPIRNIDG
jgi:hypothetical protein